MRLEQAGSFYILGLAKGLFVIKESNLAEGAKADIMRREKWKKKILIVHWTPIGATHWS